MEQFLHQQGLDTTTSSGRALFGMLSVFSEFERAIIQERVCAGMVRARSRGTKSGKPINARPSTPRAARPSAPPTRLAELVYKLWPHAQFGVSVESVRRCLV